MTPWIFILNPFERWPPMLEDYSRVFDMWEAGGVRGIVVGRLVFTAPDGTTIPTFAADPKVYARFGVAAPPEQPRDLDKERRFSAMLDDAAARGWEIMIFDVRRDGGSLPAEEDPHGAAKLAAAAQDILNAYPQAHGVILDGPGEHPYELMFHRNREFLAVSDSWRQRFALLGYDVDRIERGVADLRSAFQSLTTSQVRYWSAGGALGALNLFDLSEDVVYWLRARRAATRDWMGAVRERFAHLDRDAKLGAIPRAPALSALTGQDYTALGEHFDFVFPKHYYWHRGFDGLFGSVARWVSQLVAWNPTLSEEDAFAVVKLWFGLDLPGISRLTDFDRGFPPEFFSQTVGAETARALAAVGDHERVIAWVSTGRMPHAGEMMTSRDLHGILTASRDAGLRRFVFHATHLIGAAEWTVLSEFCGTPWRDDGSWVWPADTDRITISFSGRPATKPVP